MKKLILMLLVSSVILGFGYSQSIKILKPVTGIKILKGSTYLISWSASGTSNGFKLTLWKNGILKKIINSKFPPGNGVRNYSWKVPHDCGSGYQIKIKEKSTPVSDTSGKFTVKGCYNLINKKLQKKHINKFKNIKIKVNVSEPFNNGKYEVGKKMQIKWDNKIGTSSNVRIDLGYSKANGWTYSETIFNNYSNSGFASWIPVKKYSWPGTKLMIKIQAVNNSDIYGYSGVFSVFNPKPAKSKVIVVSPNINNKKKHKINNYPTKECLSVPLPLPGRAPVSKELKTGHYIRGGKHNKCYWQIEYYYYSELNFNLSKIKGKEILRAELMLSLSEAISQGPTGTLATNEFCNSESKIVENGQIIKSFSIFKEGTNKKIDLINSIIKWASSDNQGKYLISIKGRMDYVPNSNSICLKYYSSPILFVEYKE